MIVDEEYIIEHFGKKGMKWGVRGSGKSGHQLNKASRKKDRQKLDKDIDKARKAVSTTSRFRLTDKGSKSHTAYKKARATYKKDKQVMGSREARKILNKAANKRINEVNTSKLAKSGKETALVVAAAVGYVGMRVLMANKGY